MKNYLISILCAILAISCSENSKEIITPDNPQQSILPVKNKSITLGYLQRDTIKFSNDINLSEVQLTIIEGSNYITVLQNNIVVGRRIGTSKILAQCGDMSTTIEVKVNSEEYVPVKNVICNINSKNYISDAPTTWQCCESLSIKFNGVEPSDASYYRINKISINSYDETGKLWWKPEDVSGNIHNFSSLNKVGNIDEIDPIEMRVFPRNGFKVDNTPCFILNVDIDIWPEDLTMNEWDRQQIIKLYGTDEGNTICKSFIFKANENVLSVDKDSDTNGSKDKIFIKAGETRKLTASLKYPEEFNKQELITWNMDGSHNEYMNMNNLTVTPEGTLSLSSSYNGENYPYYNGLQQDTVYIGYIRASFLKEESEQYSDMFKKYDCDENPGNMCYHNARHWIQKLQKEDKVDVYWVRK